MPTYTETSYFVIGSDSSCEPSPCNTFVGWLRNRWTGLTEEIGQAQKLCTTLLAATSLGIALVFIVVSYISIGGCEEFPLKKPRMELMMTLVFAATSFAMVVYLVWLGCHWEGHEGESHSVQRKREEAAKKYDEKLSRIISFVTLACFGIATIAGHVLAAYAYYTCTDNVKVEEKTYTRDIAVWDIAYNASAGTFAVISMALLFICQLPKIELFWLPKLTFGAAFVSTGLLAIVTFANEVSGSSALLSWQSSCPNASSPLTFLDDTCEKQLTEKWPEQNTILFPMILEYCIVAFATLHGIWSRASNLNGCTEGRQQGGKGEAESDITDYFIMNEAKDQLKACKKIAAVCVTFAICSVAFFVLYIVLLTLLQSDSETPTSSLVTSDYLENSDGNDTLDFKETSLYFKLRIAVYSSSIVVMLFLFCEITFLPKLKRPIEVKDIVMSVTAVGTILLCAFCIAADIVCLQDTSSPKNTSLCERGDREYFILECQDYSITAIACLLQALLLSKLSRRNLHGYRRRKEKVCCCRCLPGLLLFLFVTNALAWGADSFLEVKIHEEDVLFSSQQDVIGSATWRFITQLLYPFAIFFRFHSAFLFFEAFVVAIFKPGPSLDNHTNGDS